MELIASETHADVASMLDGYDYPAILVNGEYRILATNDLYRETFGSIDRSAPAHCYAVSHGYDRPCDQAGEDCPLAATLASGKRERVLHIHQTPRGPEHVDVEMRPVVTPDGKARYFVELLKPVPVAGAVPSDQQMVGKSAAFNKMLELITRVAPGNAAVLLQGESGSGKELAARAIHQASNRKDKSLVTLECAGLTESLFESELFGHVKGAFTGANYNRLGLAQAADGGTLFLDEIGDIPLPLQVKLLRLIETGTYRPVGSTTPQRSDFRLVCATHRNLYQMVQEGDFRQDLYYRINVFPIHVPSLHDRAEDIPLISVALLSQISARHKLMASALKRLQQHTFEGNVRELRNLLARTVVLTSNPRIDAEVVERAIAVSQHQRVDKAANNEPEEVDLDTLQHRYLRQLMDIHRGDRRKVAAIAGISERTLYRKLETPELS